MRFGPPDPRGMLVVKGVLGVAMGVWLLLPFSTGTLDAAPFAGIRELFGGSDYVLGIILLVLGAAILVGIHLHRWLLLRIAAVCIGAIFVILATGVFASNPSALAVPVYAVMALTTFWAVLSLSRGVRATRA